MIASGDLRYATVTSNSTITVSNGTAKLSYASADLLPRTGATAIADTALLEPLVGTGDVFQKWKRRIAARSSSFFLPT